MRVTRLIQICDHTHSYANMPRVRVHNLFMRHDSCDITNETDMPHVTQQMRTLGLFAHLCDECSRQVHGWWVEEHMPNTVIRAGQGSGH